MAPQITINFNELPVTIVIKKGTPKAWKNVEMIFSIGLRSILVELLMSNSMEPLRGLERANKKAPKTHKSLTKKAVKNLKRNKCRSGKRRAKPSTPKIAPSPALEIMKTTLRRASQQRSSFRACPLMVMPANTIPTPCLKQVPTRRGTPIREVPTNLVITLSRQAQVPSQTPQQTRVPAVNPKHVWVSTPPRMGTEPRHPRTSKSPNGPFGERIFWVKKAPSKPLDKMGLYWDYPC